MCSYKWYILNQNKVIYYIVFNEIVFIKYHIGYSDIDSLLIYELDKEDFALFKKESSKKKNTVDIKIDSITKQLYLCDKTRIIDTAFITTQIVQLTSNLINQIPYTNYTNINPLFTIQSPTRNSIILDSIDLGNYKAYEIQKDCLVNEIYINKIFNVLSLDEVVWSLHKDDAVCLISNLDGDLNIYIKLIVRYE